jgi:hypothetical protein
LEDLDAEVDINSAWKTIIENIKISAKENLGHYKLMKRKTCFYKSYAKLLDQRKRARLQWLQNPSKINGNNLTNVRCEASRHFRNKKQEYLINRNLEMNNRNMDIRDRY